MIYDHFDAQGLAMGVVVGGFGGGAFIFNQIQVRKLQPNSVCIQLMYFCSDCHLEPQQRFNRWSLLWRCRTARLRFFFVLTKIYLRHKNKNTNQMQLAFPTFSWSWQVSTSLYKWWVFPLHPLSFCQFWIWAAFLFPFDSFPKLYKHLVIKVACFMVTEPSVDEELVPKNEEVNGNQEILMDQVS